MERVPQTTPIPLTVLAQTFTAAAFVCVIVSSAFLIDPVGDFFAAVVLRVVAGSLYSLSRAVRLGKAVNGQADKALFSTTEGLVRGFILILLIIGGILLTVGSALLFDRGANAERTYIMFTVGSAVLLIAQIGRVTADLRHRPTGHVAPATAPVSSTAPPAPPPPPPQHGAPLPVSRERFRMWLISQWIMLAGIVVLTVGSALYIGHQPGAASICWIVFGSAGLISTLYKMFALIHMARRRRTDVAPVVVK